MKIKDLYIRGRTFLAPLAGMTNLPFRLLVKECGCAVVCSEMVTARGILHHSKKSLTLLDSEKREQPLSVQLFGSDSWSLAEGVKIVEKMNVASIIDINFGCSVKKIVRQGAGVALMKEPENARVILRAIRQTTDLPLTIKMRSGWDSSGEQALDIARIAQDEGVDAITIHPRTAGQGFRGKADWSLIERLKKRKRKIFRKPDGTDDLDI